MDDTELRAQFVVISPGGEVQSLSCLIRKNFLEQEFLEDVWQRGYL